MGETQDTISHPILNPTFVVTFYQSKYHSYNPCYWCAEWFERDILSRKSHL